MGYRRCPVCMWPGAYERPDGYVFCPVCDDGGVLDTYGVTGSEIVSTCAWQTTCDGCPVSPACDALFTRRADGGINIGAGYRVRRTI